MNSIMSNIGIIIGGVLAIWGIMMFIKKEPVGYKPNYTIKNVPKYCTIIGIAAAITGSIYVVLELLHFNELVLIGIEFALLMVLLVIELRARKMD